MYLFVHTCRLQFIYNTVSEHFRCFNFNGRVKEDEKVDETT